MEDDKFKLNNSMASMLSLANAPPLPSLPYTTTSTSPAITQHFTTFKTTTSPSAHQQANNAATFAITVVSCSSETEDHPCSNILELNSDSVWISQEGLPQEFIVKISHPASNTATAAAIPIVSNSKAVDYETSANNTISVIGWNCAKKYVNNPRHIEVFVATNNEPDTSYKLWASLTARENEGIHLFSITPIDKSYSYIKFKITETFGGSRVFLNRIYLLNKRPDEQSLNNLSPQKNQTLLSPNTVKSPATTIVSASQQQQRSPSVFPSIVDDFHDISQDLSDEELDNQDRISLSDVDTSAHNTSININTTNRSLNVRLIKIFVFGIV